MCGWMGPGNDSRGKETLRVKGQDRTLATYSSLPLPPYAKRGRRQRDIHASDDKKADRLCCLAL